MGLRKEPVPGTSTTLVGGFEDKLLICRAEKTTVGETSCNQTKEGFWFQKLAAKEAMSQVSLLTQLKASQHIVAASINK